MYDAVLIRNTCFLKGNMEAFFLYCMRLEDVTAQMRNRISVSSDTYPEVVPAETRNRISVPSHTYPEVVTPEMRNRISISSVTYLEANSRNV
jgi:hypothetical protein